MFKNKKLKYYCVKTADNPAVMLSVVDTKKEAEEYINTVLYIKNMEHFDSWCYFNHIPDSEKQNAWLKYYNTVLDKEQKSKYWYQEMYYTKSEVAAIVRMFCGCKPLGCSYELPEESTYLESKKVVKELMTKQLMEYMSKEMDDPDYNLDEEKKEEIVQ